MQQPKLSIVEGCKIKMAACASKAMKLKKISQKTIDMTQHAGERVRIWMETDGTYSTDKHKNHWWQIAEFDVPAIEYEEVEKEHPVTKEKYKDMVAKPLDLKNVDVTVWEMPD